MSQKTITILGIALVVLVGIFMLQKYLSHPSKNLESFGQLKVPFDTTAVQYIKVFKQDYPDSGLVFAHQDTGWVVTNYYRAQARNTDVEKIISDLYAIGGTVRGESEDLYPDFDITDQNALQIRLLGVDSSLLAHVYVGKGGQDGHSCFMRLPGSPKVYLADNNFLSRFSAWGASPATKLPADRWVSLSLCRINRDAITSFKLHTPKVDYEFASITAPPVDSISPPSRSWKQLTPEKGTILDDAKIKGMQSNIGSLTAQGVVDPINATKFGLDKPSYSIWAADSLGRATQINFSDKIDTLENRYITVSGTNSVYKGNKWTFEHIFVTPFEKPEKTTAAKPQKATATKLESNKKK